MLKLVYWEEGKRNSLLGKSDGISASLKSHSDEAQKIGLPAELYSMNMTNL